MLMLVVPAGTPAKPPLNQQAVVRPDGSILRQLESAITSIPQCAVLQLHLEETLTVDGDVHLRARLGNIALAENLRRADRPRAVADLNARGQEVAPALIRARGARGLIKQILKLDLVFS